MYWHVERRTQQYTKEMDYFIARAIDELYYKSNDETHPSRHIKNASQSINKERKFLMRHK